MIKIDRIQSGDTLVEVLLATAILSIVLAGAFTLSNRATRLSQNANERTQVSNLMQREAELIRTSILEPGSTFWNGIIYTTENKDHCDPSTGSNENNGIYMDDSLNRQDIGYSSGKMVDAYPDDLFDIWIQPVDGIDYVDFFVYACWEGIGGEVYQGSGLVTRIAK